MSSEHFKSYLEVISARNADLARSLLSSVAEFMRSHIETFSFNEHSTGLLLGKVQSGKTSEMFGIISACADMENGFRYFILLTTDNNNLHAQTIERAFRDLLSFNICNEYDDGRFCAVSFRRPTLVVLKKNSNVLRSWRGIIGGFPPSRNEPLMILDDEGDAASLNTKVNLDEVSTINGLLTEIRNLAPSSIHIQVTATPQANILQTAISGYKPKFVHIFEPGTNYLGGDYFYSEGSPCLRIIDESEASALVGRATAPDGLRRAILTFLVTSAYKLQIQNEQVNNFLIHPSLRIQAHELVADLVRKYLDAVRKDIEKGSNALKDAIDDTCDDLRRTHPRFPMGADLLDMLPAFTRNINLVIINMTTPPGTTYDSGCNIVIGGNSLGRGLTFPRLQTVYYTRQSRTPQIDTMWQHSRMFGYDRDPELCRIFLPPSLMNTFRALNEANEALFRTIIERGIEGINVLVPKGTRPTRLNVVDQSAVALINGGVNYFPSFPLDSNTTEIDRILGLADKEEIIALPLAEQILRLVRVEDDETMDIDQFVRCLEMLEGAGETRCTLIVRCNREITRGTGTLLSPTDRTVVNSKREETVLVMYRLNGGTPEGWKGKPLWVPNIKFPDGWCFYSGD